MTQTIEAEIDGDGTIRLREPVADVGKARRALVIVLDEPPTAVGNPPVDYRQFLPPPVDEWHRKLREAATPCGTPLPTTTYSREEMYD